MTAPHGDQIVAGYIAQLERALASVPPSRRAEIVDEIGEHIAQVRGQIADESDADVLNLLDRLGDPVELAASAPTEEPTPVTPGGGGPLASGWLDIAALVLTPILWPVGVILLWMSPSWSTRDKLIGTLVPPGGYIGTYLGLTAMFIVGAVDGGGCSAGGDSMGNITTTCWGIAALPGIFQVMFVVAGILLWIAWLILPVLTGIYLGVRLRRRSRSSTHEDVDSAARSGGGAPASGWLNIAAVVLTPILWPVGVILLWMSPAWSRRDKLIGTLVPPGGYFGTFFVFGLVFVAEHALARLGEVPAVFVLQILVWLVWLTLPALTGIYLGLRLRRGMPASATRLGPVPAIQSR